MIKYFGVAAMLAASLGCGSKPAASEANLFPESGQVTDWKKVRETRTFPASELWQYIDGGAEKYLRAGVEKTLAADYRFQDKIDAVADIYVMRTAEGAAKIFDSEASENSKPVAIGDTARLYSASLTFRKGRYFVRLVAYQESAEVAPGLTSLARAVESKLSQ